MRKSRTASFWNLNGAYSRYAVDAGAIPFAPHLLLPLYMKEESERGLALFMDMVFLSKCDELWVFGDKISSGMQAEIDKATRKNMKIRYFTDDFDGSSSRGPILEGSRNKTMSLFAGKVLKRYGHTEKAKEVYLEHAKKCDPPLDKEELDTIWNSAVRFFNKKVVTSEGYVPPDEYWFR